MKITESWWDVSAHIRTVLYWAWYGYCLHRLMHPFMHAKTDGEKSFPERHASALGGAVYAVVMGVLYYIPPLMPSMVAYAIGSLAAFVVLCVLNRGYYRQKVFLSAMFFILRWLTVIMGGSLYSLVWRFVYAHGGFAQRDMWAQYLHYLATDILGLALDFTFMWLSVRGVCRLYRYKDEDMALWEMLLFMIPNLMCVTDYALRLYSDYTFVTSLEAKYVLFDFLDFLHSSFSVAIILSMLWLHSRLRRQQKETKQEELLSRQMEDMRRHIAEVEGLYQDIRSLKHDMGNHLQTIDGLYEQGEALAAKEYAAKLQSQFLAATEDIKTGNPITDVLLSGYCQQMREYGIDCRCEFCFPKKSNIEAFELSVIISNAMENAIEAARECGKPFIRIASHQRRQVYFLEVENSFVGERFCNADSGLPITTKQGTGHGYGIENIRRTARKYYGDIEIGMEEGVFWLRVMLCG